jgi:hypothetical protein
MKIESNKVNVIWNFRNIDVNYQNFGKELNGTNLLKKRNLNKRIKWMKSKRKMKNKKKKYKLKRPLSTKI